LSGWTFPINGTCGTPSTFSLGNGGQQTFTNIPINTLCSVSENLSTIPVPSTGCTQGSTPVWSASYSPASATIGPSPQTITVLNGLECSEADNAVGELIITKQAVHAGAIVLPNLAHPVTVNCGGADTTL